MRKGESVSAKTFVTLIKAWLLLVFQNMLISWNFQTRQPLEFTVTVTVPWVAIALLISAVKGTFSDSS